MDNTGDVGSGLHLRSNVTSSSSENQGNGNTSQPISSIRNRTGATDQEFGPLQSIRTSIRVPLRGATSAISNSSLASLLNLPSSSSSSQAQASSTVVSTGQELASILRRASTTTTAHPILSRENSTTDEPRILNNTTNHTVINLDELFQNLSEDAGHFNTAMNNQEDQEQLQENEGEPQPQQQADNMNNAGGGGQQDQQQGGGIGVNNYAIPPNENSIWQAINQLIIMNPELRCVLVYAQKYIPFLILILFKLLFDHGIGMVMAVFLFVTFYHANSVVKQQVLRCERRTSWGLLAVVVNLSACIAFIFYVYGDEKIHYSAFFLPPPKIHTILGLLFIVVVNDFILKFVAVILKIVVIFLPAKVVAHRRRGKYYLFIERVNQFHRELAPIQPWLTYLLDYERIPGKVIGVILVAAYMILKGKILLGSAKDLFAAFVILTQQTSFGKTPTSDQMKAAGETCPICYDVYKDATLLSCNHIFCEDCLSAWFDRERTCPLCRAQVSENPEWRDGSTSLAVTFA